MATIRQQKGVLERDDNDKIIMSSKNLITICEADGLYEFPELNNKIYLHFKGFTVIQNLDPFVNLKTLYLENNLITKIQGLEKLTQLTHLFLQHNIIKEIEGLENNTALVNLNLSHNQISGLKNLSHLVRLESISLSSNQLKDHQSLAALTELPALSCCGLEDNQIGYEEKIFEDVFKKMPSLKVLYLQGNDFIREFPYYRKRLIGSIPELTYLDDRPVFPDERQLSEAFVEGGKDRMNAVLKENAEKKQEQKREEFAANQKKSMEIKANRIIFFERNMKKGLIEVETLKKKLNRARLIGDIYMVSQLEECLIKENNLVNDAEETLGMLRKSLLQLQAAQQQQQGEQQQQKKGQEEQFGKEDIEKLLLSLMHGTSTEEEFNEESLTIGLEQMISDIVSKISKEGEEISSIVEAARRQVDVKASLEEFKLKNPNHLEDIRMLKMKEFIKARTINEDPLAHVDEQPQYITGGQKINPDYLDDLE